MIGKKRIIEDDLFSIVKRLKSIDPTYFVVENYKAKRLEIHSQDQRGGTLALVLPYRVLDERTIRYVLRTRCERRGQLLEEIERHNEKLIKKQIGEVVKKTEKGVEKAYGYI